MLISYTLIVYDIILYCEVECKVKDKVAAPAQLDEFPEKTLT
jgi:hypothetical protein